MCKATDGRQATAHITCPRPVRDPACGSPVWPSEDAHRPRPTAPTDQPATEGLLRLKLGSRGVPASDGQAAARLFSFSAQQAKLACTRPPPGSGPSTAARPGPRGAARADGAGQVGAVPSWGGVWRTTQGQRPWLDGCAGLSCSLLPSNRKRGPRGGASEAGRAGGVRLPGPPVSPGDPGSAPPGPSLLTPKQTTASRWQ